MYNGLYYNSGEEEEEESGYDDDDDVCNGGPANPFDARDWCLHEKFHQASEGRYRNVQFHASRQYPEVLTVTMEHLCPITCFLDEDRMAQDDETVTMTCHVASLNAINYGSLPPLEDTIRPDAEYVEMFKAAFEHKKTEIQEEVTKVMAERPDVEGMNITLRVVMTQSALRGRRDVTSTYTRGLSTRDLDRVEQGVGRLLDECVDYLLEHIDHYCQQEPRASFNIVI